MENVWTGSRLVGAREVCKVQQVEGRLSGYKAEELLILLM